MRGALKPCGPDVGSVEITKKWVSHTILLLITLVFTYFVHYLHWQLPKLSIVSTFLFMSYLHRGSREGSALTEFEGGVDLDLPRAS